ncbi:hypothetical protein [Actinomadura violacea]|uniref:Uncharacterized protein n=1 Tax=Actinomadura violacea TaxID=2819934 RepID=A0ABS3S7N6_9ACTN|nr:hypothetical protein [Actinomadura violacea]MBO2465013.1 hypothetical protein [Actinomadura violacea]
MIALGVVVALLATAVTGWGGFLLYEAAFSGTLQPRTAVAHQEASKPTAPTVAFLLCSAGNAGILPGTSQPSPCRSQIATQTEKDQLRQELQQSTLIASVTYLSQPQLLTHYGGHMPDHLPPSDAFVVSPAEGTTPDDICSRFSGRAGVMTLLNLQSTTTKHCRDLRP